MKDTKYFKAKEFQCKCGCNTNGIEQSFVDKLTQAREIAGIPFVITSGYRCAEHNKAVGGVAGSAHTTGWAVDISAGTGEQKFKIVKALIDAGFTRIGVAKTFIHVDMDSTKPSPTIWLY
mgnify:FL=1|jgi:uncharacterized protein YcbK (DUF882 family)